MKDDTISRQEAIEAFKKELTIGEQKGKYVTICSAVSFDGAKQILEALPAVPSQSEIVRCKDCAFSHRYIDFDGSNWIECQNPNGLNRDVADDGYCYAGAERETE